MSKINYPKKIIDKPLPIITNRKKINNPRFTAEQYDIEFSNGEKRVYEKLSGGVRGSVLVVAVNDKQELLLIREFCGGKEQYELAFPKGKIETDETPEKAAQRELQEETGYNSDNIRLLKKISLAPGYMSHQTHILLAQNIYWDPLEGDEPEPIDCYFWSIKNINALLNRNDFTEARSILAFFMVKKIIEEQKLLP